MKLRTGILLTIGVTGTCFGFRGLFTEEIQVVSENLDKEKDIPYEDLFNQDLGKEGLVNQNESQLMPATSTGNSEEPWDWGVGYTEAQKQKNREDAKRILDTLDDYSFKFFLPCTVGTGWILDYQIPKDPKQYPTKWYVGTNLHVIWRLNFTSNDYEQLLPNTVSWTKQLREKYKDNYEEAKNYKGLVRNRCDDVNKLGYVDLNISKQATWENGRQNANIGGVANKEINEPKLFFSAINFLDREVVGDRHFVDFAVLEIEFTTPEIAEKVTNGFAKKYNVDNNSQAIKFGRSIEKRYKTPKQLWEAKDNYYLLAYPAVEGKADWKHTTNYDDNTTFASHLVGDGWDYSKVDEKDKYRGFVSSKRVSPFIGPRAPKFKWDGLEYHEFGHRYHFAHNSLGGGSSGGMFVDSDGYAVGVTMHGLGSGTVAQPFRSDGIALVEGKITPRYDLILGGFERQKFSYRSQLEKYILKDDTETWLSKSGGWKAAQ